MGFRGVAPLVVISMMTVSAAAPATASGKEPLWIFFGANLGYTSVSPDSTIRESDRDGYAAHLKVLGSKYWSKWVADFGLGYQHHVASGKDEFSPLRDASVKVKTRSLFVELSPRYRVGPRWQVGAVVNGFFGTDVSFGESVVDDSSFSLAAGARADYEKPGENQRWRYGLQIMHDLTVSNRGVWCVMADIQYGIPFSNGGSSVEPTAAPDPTVSERPKAPQFAEVTPEMNVKVYLGEAVVRFKTASAELDPMSHRILEKMTKYLKQAPDAWKKIRVEGH